MRSETKDKFFRVTKGAFGLALFALVGLVAHWFSANQALHEKLNYEKKVTECQEQVANLLEDYSIEWRAEAHRQYKQGYEDATVEANLDRIEKLCGKNEKCADRELNKDDPNFEMPDGVPQTVPLPDISELCNEFAPPEPPEPNENNPIFTPP